MALALREISTVVPTMVAELVAVLVGELSREYRSSNEGGDALNLDRGGGERLGLRKEPHVGTPVLVRVGIAEIGLTQEVDEVLQRGACTRGDGELELPQARETVQS